MRPLAQDEDWSKDSHAAFRHFDGTVITMSGRKTDDKHWVRLAVSFDGSPGEARDKAEKLNARLKDWAYEIQGYRYDNVFRPLDDLLEKK